MTVLHLISSEGYYGAEAMLVALARACSQFGCRCVVGVFRDSRFLHVEVSEHAAREGLAVEVLHCAGRCDWRAVARLRRLLDIHRVDVVHAHGYKADLYAFLAAWPKRTALVSTCHNWPNRRPVMQAYAILDRLVLRRFDRVVAACDLVADILRRSGLASARLSTICNGVEVERFHVANPVLRQRGRAVGFVGRLVDDKGGAVLLQAARDVVALCPATTFVMVGEGPSRSEWEALTVRLGIGSNVVFLGTRDDMPAVYASFDIVVLPSFNEATPMCLLEAMAAGKPVIATRVGSVRRLIVPGVTGVLIEPGDRAALAGSISRLLRDPDLAHRLGENGRAHVAQHFSAEAMARSYIEVYRQALANRKPAGSVTAAFDRA